MLSKPRSHWTNLVSSSVVLSRMSPLMLFHEGRKWDHKRQAGPLLDNCGHCMHCHHLPSALLLCMHHTHHHTFYVFVFFFMATLIAIFFSFFLLTDFNGIIIPVAALSLASHSVLFAHPILDKFGPQFLCTFSINSSSLT